MKMKYIIVVAIISAMSICGWAQSLPEIPRNVKQAYQEATRNENGAPGENYWQNEADYNIDIQFDPETRNISGTVEVTYTNNSPDSLHQLLIKLYPNVFKRGAVRDMPVNSQDVGDGVKLEDIRINGEHFDLDKAEVQGTNAFFPIDPLPIGSKINLEMDYSYTLEAASPAHRYRAGQIDESTFLIAYFFPRIAVYDDIDGWNVLPFLSLTDFYNDFSNFDVEIRVPNKFSVWATGDLENAAEVFTQGITERISKAAASSEEIKIIEQTDLENDKVTQNNEFNTFHFTAENVTDFAFATSDHYIWNSTSTVVDSVTNRRTRVDVVFDPASKNFDDVLGIAKRTVGAMSFYYPKWPFPYPHATVFQGLEEMEFPMMANVHNPLNPAYTTQIRNYVTIHELFHTIFPFYVGTNEKKYAWMDEGWATVGEWKLYPYFYPGEVNDWGIEDYSRDAGFEMDEPIMNLSDNMPQSTYFLNSYYKPAMAFLYLQDMLGDEKFFNGLHYFIRNWKGKHPIPWDFFNSMNEGSGENLNWFWDTWFYQDGYPDLAIESFSTNEVMVRMLGNKPVPINLNITYTDGSSETIHKSIAIWKEGNDEHRIILPSQKEIQVLELKGTHIPDIDLSNNIWQK